MGHLALIVAVALAAGEIATTSFFLGPFALGAFEAAGAVALAGAGAAASWVVFTVATIAAFASCGRWPEGTCGSRRTPAPAPPR